MSRYLLIDVGAGTMDVLFYDDREDLHYKAVVRSPVREMPERILKTSGNLLLTGCEMGGGNLSAVLRQRARTDKVVMSASAAATVHHQREKVRSLGIEIVEDDGIAGIREIKDYTHHVLADIEEDRIRQIVEGFGVSFSFDVIGICAQDHGVAPAGQSHLDYRHGIFRKRLDQEPLPHTLLFSSDEIPETLNRLRAMASCAQKLPTQEVYAMDSGMAAILGASLDFSARGKERILVLDIATSHTVCAALEKDEIAGFFEYHTADITLARLESLLVDLADGRISHPKILEEGGHGAYLRKAFGFDAVEAIIATGPKRKLLKDARLPIVFGAPFGDNMMTGTAGLLEAIRRRKRLPPVTYF